LQFGRAAFAESFTAPCLLLMRNIARLAQLHNNLGHMLISAIPMKVRRGPWEGRLILVWDLKTTKTLLNGHKKAPNMALIVWEGR
jgi:hypothetical protein